MNHSASSYDYIDERATRSLTHITDRQLLGQVARGEGAAFGELYQRYSLPLYNYLLRLVHEPSVAEDLLQEVFVAVWQGAGRFRGRSQVSTWLYRIAHNQAVSWLRRVRPVSDLEDVPELVSGDDPAEQAMANWRAEQVRDALDQLSPKHRAVLELTFFHGFSCAEIAEIVGCPVGTVKSRMSYARRYLNDALLEKGVEEQE